MQKIPAKSEQLEQLDLVRALSREIAASIAAIEKNNLQQLQASIANQEKLAHLLIAASCSQPAATDQELRAACLALAQINRVYAGVIKRSQRCADLLCALYGIGGKGYGKEVVAERTDWICEA